MIFFYYYSILFIFWIYNIMIRNDLCKNINKKSNNISIILKFENTEICNLKYNIFYTFLNGRVLVALKFPTCLYVYIIYVCRLQIPESNKGWARVIFFKDQGRYHGGLLSERFVSCTYQLVCYSIKINSFERFA